MDDFQHLTSQMRSFLELAADSFTQFLTGKESRFRGNMLFFPFMGDKLMPPNVEITASINHALSDGAIGCGGGATATTSSPLKRSDARPVDSFLPSLPSSGWPVASCHPAVPKIPCNRALQFPKTGIGALTMYI